MISYKVTKRSHQHISAYLFLRFRVSYLQLLLKVMHLLLQFNALAYFLCQLVEFSGNLSKFIPLFCDLESSDDSVQEKNAAS
jgi:hypothetical protein